MINIKNLTKYYGDVRAVDDVTVEIRRGEILGLLGPNGAGKTTIMRILTGYLKPTDGTIMVKDFDVLEDGIEIKKNIGYLPESAPIYPDMLTYEYLQYVASIRRIPGGNQLDRIEELSDLCGLDDVMHKPVKELSRGYKQRVGLAHAMMSDPEILVLDEPTAGLDPNQIVQIRSIIREMGREKTVIFSTHILSEAEATCDRIVIINKGSIVADGTPSTLGKTALQSQLIRMTFAGAGFGEIADVISAVEGVNSVEDETSKAESQNSVSVVAACDGDRRADIYRAVKQRNWILLELSRERQSLEDTFRQLTLQTEDVQS